MLNTVRIVLRRLVVAVLAAFAPLDGPATAADDVPQTADGITNWSAAFYAGAQAQRRFIHTIYRADHDLQENYIAGAVLTWHA